MKKNLYKVVKSFWIEQLQFHTAHLMSAGQKLRLSVRQAEQININHGDCIELIIK